MKVFEKRRRLKRLAYSPVSLVILAVLLLLLLHSVWGVFTKSQISKAARERAEKELQALETRQEVLSQELQRLNTEAGVEAEIRERFQVAKQGEGVIIIEDKKTE